jgi:mannose-6-phosphate isomerase-like protein (cupin superfamily)
MKKVRIEDIGGKVIKDTSEYLLKDNPFGEHLTLSSTQLRANQSTTGHSHDDQEEVYYFYKGIGEMEIDDYRFSVKSGDIVCINIGEFHRVFNTGAFGLYFICVFEGGRNH